jgi:hypothetical protein
MILQVGGIYVRLFLKDPKFPLRNPKRFLEGLLDQYLSSIAATHYETQPVDPELPLLLSAALVCFVAAVAYEGRRETMASEEVDNGNYADRKYEPDDGSTQPSQTPQERVRLSCLRVLHQLAASTTCAEAMAATSVGTPQVYVKQSVSLLLKWLSCDSVNMFICNDHICSFERDGHMIKFAKGIGEFFYFYFFKYNDIKMLNHILFLPWEISNFRKCAKFIG